MKLEPIKFIARNYHRECILIEEIACIREEEKEDISPLR